MTNALPHQQSLPAIDPIVVRTRLRELFESYSDRVMDAESGAQVNELVHAYATTCLRELEDVAGSEAEELRAYYRDMSSRTSTDEGELGCKATL